MIDSLKENSVSQDYPELHHYTGWSGLEGILRSQSLWSVRYDHMNDPTEMEYARGFMRSELDGPMRAHLIAKKRKSLRFDRRIRELGGIDEAIKHEGTRWIDIHYLASLTADERHDVPFAVPHITSFCSHRNDQTYEQQNGLLSQWRGYGQEGAFAIVFDTSELETLIRLELGRWDYITAQFFDVHYDRETAAAPAQFARTIDLMAANWIRNLDGEKGDLDELFDLFTKLTCRLKHRGFFEEREIRIVTYPVFQKYRDYRRNQKNFDPAEAEKDLKPMVTVGRKPHVALFEGLGRQLPIKRIIIGPAADQAREHARVAELVAGRISLHRSGTPYQP